MTPTMWLLLVTHAAAVILGLWLGSKIWGSSIAPAIPPQLEKAAEDGAAAKAELQARDRAEGVEHASSSDVQRRVDELRERGRTGK